MRLRHFTEEVKARRRDLVDRTLRKNTDSFEKRLMSQHKLCSPNQQIYDVLKGELSHVTDHCRGV